MKVSTKGRYGLRVMMELALRGGQGPVLVGALAESQDISAKYIHVLMGSLKTAGLVRALRGPNGGYELARDPAGITLLEVVSALESDLLSGAGPKRQALVHGVPSAAEAVWIELGTAISESLARQTLKDLAERQLALGGASYFI